MRNLKRALSLALASIMVLGMMVIGAGAANVYDSFPDKEEIVNKDAVSMLTTLGIINGEDSGKFNPTGNVTRSQMAKMISVIMNKGADNNALYADVNSGLTDISSSWAKGHINFCFTRGIIAGRGDGRFDPEANVTAAEAAKMLLVAAGYDPAKEGFTGGDWAVNVSAMASKLGVYNNYEKSTMDPLSRDDAALLIYNALDVEMIQKYDSNYPIAFGDHRTILSVMYGVYKMQGVVISNEEAALNGTDSEDASPAGKTTLEEVKIYASTTENTTTGEYEEIKGQVTLNTSTTADMLGKTVTLYVKKTTILANSTVLGVFLREDNNVVKTTTESQDTMKDFLKNSGLSVNNETAYYVNYGHTASEAAATKSMGFATTTKGDRYTSLNDNGKDVNANGSGVEMTVIDNDNDGKVDYVLYMQETLTQVVATNANKDTTTLNDFNKNKAIDNDKIVTDETLAEGDVVLTIAYGGKYYVSAPEVVTGKMDSFSSSKTKEQYIEVGGTKYYPSYDKFSADSANNTYVFNVLNCGKTDGVDFDIDYDFLLDSAGTVIAYRPSEKSLYNYALILDSGYDPGRTNSNPNGEVKVLLPDGTEGTYTLNFTASAQNIGDQLFPTLTSTQRKDNGMEELKGFLGSSVNDNTTSKPDGTLPYAYSGSTTAHYSASATGNTAGHAKGYVVGYSLNDANVLTITSIVGSNNVGAAHYNPTNTAEKPHSIAKTLSDDYDTGSARVKYNGGQLTIDQNTVAYYYTKDNNNDTVYGVAVGYSKMADVKANDSSHNSFVAATVKDSALAASILFNAEGVVAEKDYAYVLSRSSTISGYITLNVVLMDGTASTLKVERSDWDAIVATHGDDAYNTVYSYTTKNDVSEMTIGTDSKATPVGYAKKLRDGTVAFYNKNSNGTVGSYVDAYSYDKNIWNVESIATGDNAPSGAFAENIYKETILVLDAKKNTVRAAYIKSVYGGTVTEDHDFDWSLSNYKILYPYHTTEDIHKAFEAGYNVLMRGDYTLDAAHKGNVYIPAGKILYVEGSLTEAGYSAYDDGQLWVKNDYNVNGATDGIISVPTQVGGNMLFNDATTKIYSKVSVAGNIGDGSNKDLIIETGANVYAAGDLLIGATGDLTVNGHIEARNYSSHDVNVYSSKTLIARGTLTATGTVTLGSANNIGHISVDGVISAHTMNLVNGNLDTTSNSIHVTTGNLTIGANASLNADDAALTVAGNLDVDGSAKVNDATVTGTTDVAGKLEMPGVLTATGNVTLASGSTLKVGNTAGGGAITNNGGTFSTTDASSSITVKGKLSGTYAGDVEVDTNGAIIEVGTSAVVKGNLTLTGTLDVKGSLTVEGVVDDITNITNDDDQAGAQVIFGSKATVNGTNSLFFYASDPANAIQNSLLPGLTFSYVAGSTNKFVTGTNKAEATANVSFALTAPTPDTNNTITGGGATKTVTISLESGKTEAEITLAKTAIQTITVDGTNKNSVATTSATTSIAPVYTVSGLTDGSSTKFTMTVSEKGKTDITYDVTVNVAEATITATVTDGDANNKLTVGGNDVVSGDAYAVSAKYTVVAEAGKMVKVGNSYYKNGDEIPAQAANFTAAFMDKPTVTLAAGAKTTNSVTGTPTEIAAVTYMPGDSIVATVAVSVSGTASADTKLSFSGVTGGTYAVTTLSGDAGTDYVLDESNGLTVKNSKTPEGNFTFTFEMPAANVTLTLNAANA